MSGQQPRECSQHTGCPPQCCLGDVILQILEVLSMDSCLTATLTLRLGRVWSGPGEGYKLPTHLQRPQVCSRDQQAETTLLTLHHLTDRVPHSAPGMRSSDSV